MNPANYFYNNPDFAAMHIAAAAFVVGIVFGWLFWARHRRQLRNMEHDNDVLARRLEDACLRQAQLDQKTSLIG